jgi:hypothetical protein
MSPAVRLAAAGWLAAGGWLTAGGVLAGASGVRGVTDAVPNGCEAAGDDPHAATARLAVANRSNRLIVRF